MIIENYSAELGPLYFPVPSARGQVEVFPSGNSDDRYVRRKELDSALRADTVPTNLEELTNVKALRSNETRLKILVGAQGFWATAVGMALTGLVAGGVMASVLPPIATIAVGGAALGLFNMARTLRKSTGEVQVNIDGEKSTKKFVLEPQIYQKSAKEIRHLLIHEGILGDRIEPYQPGDQEYPESIDRGIFNELRKQAPKLIELAGTRCLVADFAQKSTYGSPVLNIINAGLAASLVASGKPVYVVDVKDVSNKLHSYTASASSKNKLTRMENRYDYNEVTFGYSLQTIRVPGDIAAMGEKRGIPRGILGVFKEASACAQIVSLEKEEELDRVDKRSALLDPSGPEDSSEFTTIIRDHEYRYKRTERE
ncbi:MAG: hypothetical protein HYU64_01530 [Armatimonadetes bacterium]|nr:hypothetical protein [Armatimonadota bacterium]